MQARSQLSENKSLCVYECMHSIHRLEIQINTEQM